MKKSRIHIAATIEELVEIYDTRVELCNDDIRKIFGEISGKTIAAIKKKVRDASSDVWTIGTYAIRTDIAYKVWGLDISELRKRAAYARKSSARKETS